ncbi:MAG: PKD domain-containing protein, partial [Victivallales bacterium]|nr:PKD domain-containing protein [Victivallales bacterium]
ADPLKTIIFFDATGSSCDKGEIKHWQWEFGDGSTGEGVQVSHTYTDPGRYRVVLRIGTEGGAGAKLQKTIQISPAWVESVRTGGGIWLEAEKHSGEGDGTSRIMSGRVNASGRIVTYWDKDKGHWLEWKVPVTAAGTYAIALRYASGASQALRDCQIDGTSPGTEWNGLPFAGTGGYCTQTDNWVWRLLKGKDGEVLRHSLSAGEHTLRLTNRGGGMALDAILLVPSGALSVTP